MSQHPLAEPDVLAVVARSRAVLGDPSEWTDPLGYPDSLALCVLDAIWSLGVQYQQVQNVIARYRAHRAEHGGDAAHDTLSDLQAVFAAVGGSEPFASQVVHNRGRLPARLSGLPKAEIVRQAVEALLTHSIDAADDLRRAVADATESEAKQAWLGLPSQRSGVSWRYLLMLCGLAGVKPDRMVIGFVAAALHRVPRPAETAQLVEAAAGRMGVDVRRLDHAVWRYQSGRTPARMIEASRTSILQARRAP